MSLTVKKDKNGRRRALPASDTDGESPRGRGRNTRERSSRERTESEEEIHSHEEDHEILPDGENSLVRAHVPPRGRCALCNQLLPDGSNDPEDITGRSHFIHNQYFRLLASTSGQQEEPEAPNAARGGSRSRKASRNGYGSKEHDNHNPEQLSSKSFNDGYYESFFVEVTKLGRGYRGSVFLCQHVLEGIALSEYAIKKIPVGESHSWLVRMLREVRLLEKLQHQNVIDYKHAWIEHHSPTIYGPPVPTLFVLMNLANGGNLEDYICVQHDPLAAAGAPNLTPKEILRLRQQSQNTTQIHKIGYSGSWQAGSAATPQGLGGVDLQRNPAQLRGGIGWAVEADGSSAVPARKVRYLTEEQIWSMFLDVARGLAHLHKNRIIHRDLKPPNLLLQYNDPAQRHLEPCPRVLISDFGECEILSEQEQDRRRSGATGTLEFCAPELLATGGGNGSVEQGIHADLWAMGMILYFLCFSRLPWSQVEDVDALKAEIVESARSLTVPEEDGGRVSKDLRMLIRLLLNAEGSKRPGAQYILDIYDRKRDSRS
jgi:serine/threonine protein kinase